MVELRKRKTPPPAPEKPAKKVGSTKSTVTKVKELVAETVGVKSDAKVTQRDVVPGAVVDFADFGGEVETNEGQKVTLKELVEKSKGGVVLFTYPKASTPGCTTQACLFRDSYEPINNAGFDIYGLSSDSPKSNTNFKTKQNLQYPLLCDPSFGLIKAIGLKKPGGTQRGVFVVDKAGKILAAEPGGPQATLDTVIKVVNGLGTTGADKTENSVEPAALTTHDAAPATKI